MPYQSKGESGRAESGADPFELWPDRKQLARQAARIERFRKRQHQEGRWFSFLEISEWVGLDGKAPVPDSERQVETYKELASSLIDGDFDCNGRSQVLFLSPHRDRKYRLSSEELNDLKSMTKSTWESIIKDYLSCCWVPRNLYEKWFQDHKIQIQPKFQSTQATFERWLNHLNNTKPKSAKSKTDCQKSLLQIMRAGPKYKAKKDYYKPFEKTVSYRSFCKAWDDAKAELGEKSDPSWSRAGPVKRPTP